MSEGQEILDNLLAKARRSFEAAESLLEDGHADFSASHAYHGSFYTAGAPLLSRGSSYSRHAQVVAAVRPSLREDRRAGLLRYHRLLIEAFGLRQAADYSVTPETVSEEDAEHTIREGKEFLAAARKYPKRQ
ncbi:MAG: HEPN domain-containing protein [Actinomycetota bacterium]